MLWIITININQLDINTLRIIYSNRTFFSSLSNLRRIQLITEKYARNHVSIITSSRPLTHVIFRWLAFVKRKEKKEKHLRRISWNFCNSQLNVLDDFNWIRHIAIGREITFFHESHWIMCHVSWYRILCSLVFILLKDINFCSDARSFIHFYFCFVFKTMIKSNAFGTNTERVISHLTQKTHVPHYTTWSIFHILLALAETWNYSFFFLFSSSTYVDNSAIVPNDK